MGIAKAMFLYTGDINRYQLPLANPGPCLSPLEVSTPGEQIPNHSFARATQRDLHGALVVHTNPAVVRLVEMWEGCGFTERSMVWGG